MKACILLNGLTVACVVLVVGRSISVRDPLYGEFVVSERSQQQNWQAPVFETNLLRAQREYRADAPKVPICVRHEKGVAHRYGPLAQKRGECHYPEQSEQHLQAPMARRKRLQGLLR